MFGQNKTSGTYIDLDTSTICAVLHCFDSYNFRLRRNKEMENGSLLVSYKVNKSISQTTFSAMKRVVFASEKNSIVMKMEVVKESDMLQKPFLCIHRH